MKNSYEILSPLFLKLAGFCVCIYLYVLCLQLFFINSRYINPTFFSFQQINIYFVWSIVFCVFVLCAYFSIFTFMKISNGKLYLSSMYLLYCTMFVLLLFVFKTLAYTVSNATIMLKIVLCLGFLFIFLEYLHAQTSNNYIRDKCVLAAIMGITSCVAILGAIFIYIVLNKNYSSLRSTYNMFPCLLYVLYAFRIFVFSILRKKAKTSKSLKFSFIAFLIFWFLITPNDEAGRGVTFIIDQFNLIFFIVFSFTQLIPSNYEQVSAHVISNPFQNSMIKGMIMLSIRFVYFFILAKGISIIWMRGW